MRQNHKFVLTMAMIYGIYGIYILKVYECQLNMWQYWGAMVWALVFFIIGAFYQYVTDLYLYKRLVKIYIEAKEGKK